MLAVACSKEPRNDGLDGGADGGGTAVAETGSASGSETGGDTTAAGNDGTDEGLDSSGSTGTPVECQCAPGTELIYVVSDQGELWSFDPVGNAFESIGPLACGGFDPFSMTIDRQGRAWLLLLDNIAHSIVAKGLFRVDINDPSTCEAVAYTEGLFGVFGMSFVDNPPPAACEDLFVHSYSGQGPFSEGEGIGMIGRLDADDALQVVAPSDFDGAELAGTSEGRVFALGGVDPVKIVELDRDTAEELGRLDLSGIEKTGASAMAYYGGDFYVFTEAGAPACPACLEDQCTEELAACEADPECGAVYDCLLASGGDGYEGCSGDIVGPGGPLRDCLVTQCAADCAANDVVSRVSLVDYDDSDGAGQAITTVQDFAPMRIVGAGSSTCVPVFVP